MLLFQFAKVSQKFNNLEIVDEEDGNKKSNFADRFYRTLYELLLKVHCMKAGKMDDYFALLFKAMKSDKEVPRVLAFIRRLLQMAYMNEAHFTAATLLVINEVLRVRSEVRFALFQFSATKSSDLDQKKATLVMAAGISDDSEEEVFQDVDRVEEEQVKKQK